MTDSEDESSHSLQHDKMSVSDLDDEEVSRDDVPSAELSAEAGQNSNNHEDPNPISTSSGVKLLDCHVEKRNEVSVQAAHMFATVDLMDDAAMELMSGSYSEILQSPVSCLNKVESIDGKEEKEPKLSSFQNNTLKKEDMIHFISKNMDSKTKLASPDVSYSESHAAGSQHELSELLVFPAPGLTFLSLLEREAGCIATSLDSLSEHLAASLHTVSAVTAQSLSVYKDSVCKTCDAMDANIKAMYQVMAKCEELSKSMVPIYRQAEQVKELKKLLDIMENIS